MTNPYERETVVNTSDGDDVVRVYTQQRKYIHRLLADHRFTLIGQGTHNDGIRWAEFTIPASDWNPLTGAKRRSGMTPEQRTRAADILRMNRLRATK